MAKKASLGWIHTRPHGAYPHTNQIKSCFWLVHSSSITNTLVLDISLCCPAKYYETLPRICLLTLLYIRKCLFYMSFFTNVKPLFTSQSEY